MAHRGKTGAPHGLMVHGNVDDPAPSLREQVRNGRPRHQKGTVDVGVNDHAPGVRIDFPEPGWLRQEAAAHKFHATAGIVD